MEEVVTSRHPREEQLCPGIIVKQGGAGNSTRRGNPGETR